VTPTDWLENRLECSRCGNRYLPPWREGEFRCGVCGTRLPTSSRFAGARKAAWGLVVPVALLGVALVMVGARSSGRPASRTPTLAATGTPLALQWDPTGRECLARASRARNQRDLLQHPQDSSAHAAAAWEIYNRARTAAEQFVGPPPADMGLMGGDRRQRNLWMLDIENYVAAHLKSSVEPGIRHAEDAVRLAQTADEELEARRRRADGWMLVGKYEEAKSEYLWLETLDPGAAIRPYARSFMHLGQPVPDSVRQVILQFGYFPDPDRGRSLTLGQLEQSLAAHQQWQKRRPRDPVIEMRLGALCYRLAGERAMRRPDCPMPGSDAGERMDAFIFRNYPALIQQGVGHYKRAIEQATEPWVRARAMEELAHGQLIQGHPELAIATLRQAFELSTELPMASYYARMAFQRMPRSPSQPSELGTSASGGGGPDVAMSPPGMPLGRPSGRSSRTSQTLREAGQLLRSLDTSGQESGRKVEEERQRALNQLDELFPGVATGYDASTGNVIDVDRDRVRIAMNRLAQPEDESMYAPGFSGPGGPPPGPGGPPRMMFRP